MNMILVILVKPILFRENIACFHFFSLPCYRKRCVSKKIC